ncbi:MAG TPA: DUF1109 domain-containing protein [Ramlibacter sp.]
MNTQDLVTQLARSGAAVDHRAGRRRFWSPLAIAAVASIVLVLASVGPRADWRDATGLPMFCLKIAFPAATALAASMLLNDLGHPGARIRTATALVALPTALVWTMAAAALAAALPADRAELVLGHSWLKCLISVPALSVPAFVLALVAARSLAPTRLALTGAVAGLVAGAAAAAGYALHCDEMQAPFLAVWYVLGMLVPAACGWLAGPRLLRW